MLYIFLICINIMLFNNQTLRLVQKYLKDQNIRRHGLMLTLFCYVYSHFY